MSEFIASNGLRIVKTNAGQTAYVADETEAGDSLAYLGFAEFQAFREFFEYERIIKGNPWLRAKDGELWALTGDTHPDSERQYLALEGRFFPVPLLKPSDPGWHPAPFAQDFTAGYRVWPEAVSA